ncbi:MAG: 3-phosphoshikimate 1-carboxyvinyltransferase [Dehalococcoidia bacterium]|nr:3-phosphoshikimate 1-carboxyvinyltransferase [Dehalococcoidia bacterium]
MERVVVQAEKLEGDIFPPGDKSISHRAVMFNAAAEGTATIYNFLNGEDCTSTVSCMEALGAKVSSSDGYKTVVVQGAGGAGLHEPDDVLQANNSGTTMRLISGLLAAQPFLSIITGDASLRSRPMDRLVKPLTLMGAQILGRKGGATAPLAIRGGGLRGMEYNTPVASAQVKSALILAALYASGDSVITEPSPSRDHTERLLRAMGARIDSQGNTIRISPLSAPLKSQDVRVPADISSAAFWLVAGAIHPNSRVTVRGVGANPTRTGIIDALRSMGADLVIDNQREEGGEPVADIIVTSSDLYGTVIEGDIIPSLIDELPVIALAACFAKGDTIIRDAAELRVKESDRIATTIEELSKMGARIDELPDGMIVHGTGGLRGALVRSHDDHRLAMTLGIAGVVARGETTVQGADSVDVSYPGFWQDIARLQNIG